MERILSNHRNYFYFNNERRQQRGTGQVTIHSVLAGRRANNDQADEDRVVRGVLRHGQVQRVSRAVCVARPATTLDLARCCCCCPNVTLQGWVQQGVPPDPCPPPPDRWPRFHGSLENPSPGRDVKIEIKTQPRNLEKEKWKPTRRLVKGKKLRSFLFGYQSIRLCCFFFFFYLPPSLSSLSLFWPVVCSIGEFGRVFFFFNRSDRSRCVCIETWCAGLARTDQSWWKMTSSYFTWLRICRRGIWTGEFFFFFKFRF